MNELASAMPPMPTTEAPATPAPAPDPQRLDVRFTGSGGEYFRIWIVNLLLVIVTLGIWSAWAKVRKTRYFWSNTRIGGAVFQYHGNPVAILRGRLLAAALFVAYSIAGRLSVDAGVVAGAAVALLFPWFVCKSMRFKLANTSWRGLRFGFDSTVRDAYRSFTPAVLLALVFLVSLASVQRAPGREPPNFWGVALAELLLFALLPWLHARAKSYQHGRARYGALAFRFEPSTGAFYGAYGKALLVVLPFVILVIAGLAWSVVRGGGPKALQENLLPTLVWLYAVMTLGYVFVGAFLVARLQEITWSRTHAGPVRFWTAITARGVLRVWVVNGLLTLLTAGLYWPWAAVAVARYRLECATVEVGAPLDALVAGGPGRAGTAAGEGAVDVFGWDIGL